MNNLNYPIFSKNTKVKVYRAFQGYCGIGVIKQGFSTGITPYYEVELISGDYLGCSAPTTCYVNQTDIRGVKE